MLGKLIKYAGTLEAFDHVCEPVAGRVQRAPRQDMTAGSSGANAARRLVGLGALATLPTAASGGVGVNPTAFEPDVTGWTDVATLSELAEGKPARVTPGGVPVVLVRRNGSINRLSADCAHAGGPLDEGTVGADG